MKGIMIGVDIYLLMNLIFLMVCLVKDDVSFKGFEKLSRAQKVVAEIVFVLVMSVILVPATIAVILKGGDK